MCRRCRKLKSIETSQSNSTKMNHAYILYTIAQCIKNDRPGVLKLHIFHSLTSWWWKKGQLRFSSGLGPWKYDKKMGDLSHTRHHHPTVMGWIFFDKRNLLYGWSTISISTFKTRRYLALGDFRKLGVEFFKASGNLSDFKITDCSRGLPLWWQFHFTLEIFFCCASSVCWRLALPPLSAAAATQLTSS